MVRISIPIFAFAATTMAAAVSVRSAGSGNSASVNTLHARAGSDWHLQRRQAVPSDADIDKDIQDYKNSLTPDEKAKDDKIDQEIQQEQQSGQENPQIDQEIDALYNSLNADQKAKADKIDQDEEKADAAAGNNSQGGGDAGANGQGSAGAAGNNQGGNNTTGDN